MVERILATNKFISPVLLSLFRAPDPLTADDIEDIQTILALFFRSPFNAEQALFRKNKL